MNRQPEIYVAGHRGMVGSAIVRRLLAAGRPIDSIITRTHAELDLTNQAAVRAFFSAARPTQVYLAAAKVDGIKLCESYNRQYGASHGVDYRSVMPTNLYGPGDNYHPENSHVIPALIRRFHEDKTRPDQTSQSPIVTIWGTGTRLHPSP